MRLILILLFLSIFSLDYLSRIAGLIHPAISLAPDALSVIATILVLGRLVRTKRFDVNVKYLVFFLLFAIHLVNGAIINDAAAGGLVAGLRVYLKFLPFFFVPIVYEFSDREMKGLMLLLLGVLILQLPISVLQRWVLFPDKATGDVVRGSVETGAFLSIILVCAISVLFALYLKKMIRAWTFGWLFLLLFLPTTLNETKGTIILFPFALGVPVLLMEGRKRFQGAVLVAAIGAVALGLFSFLYQYTQVKFVGQDDTITDFFEPDRFQHYMAPRTAGIETMEERYGRVDVVVAAFEEISKDPVTLLVGFGMGSVTPSPIPHLSAYRPEFVERGITETSAPYILLETGVLGALLWLVFFTMLFRDSQALSRRDGLVGALALGWLGVLPVIVVALFYKAIIPVNAIMYLFWFYCGHVAASHYRAGLAASGPRRSLGVGNGVLSNTGAPDQSSAISARMLS
ncbi:MAG: hypothetical protein ACNA7W_01835 [Pseudomonadales bacterium]